MDKLRLKKACLTFWFMILTLSACTNSTEEDTTDEFSSVTLSSSSEYSELSSVDVESYLDFSSDVELSSSDEPTISDGENTYTWEAGTYSGYWRDGKANGHGIFTAEGYTLEGTFVDNKLKTGSATVKSNSYEIYFTVSDNEISNKVEINFSNGDTYSGEWDNGLSGSGSMNFQNGDSFCGDFLNGKRHGCGVYSWENGALYSGEWSEDKMNGEGVYYYNGGDTAYLSGSFVDNVPNGTLKYFDNENTYITEWENGKCTEVKLGGE